MLTFSLVQGSGSWVTFFIHQKQQNVFLKTYKAPASASPFFSAEGNETRSKKCHMLMSAVKFSTNGLWMQYLTKNWAWDRFLEKYCTHQRWHPNLRFLADKSCLLFSIILKVLSGWEVIRIQGKCIKSYKNFWKDFVVVEQNLTRPKGDFWSYLNRPYEIVVVCRHLGHPDDWEYIEPWCNGGEWSKNNFVWLFILILLLLQELHC